MIEIIVYYSNFVYICIRSQQQTVANGYKNVCHGINRDFVSVKIVPTANIVTAFLKTKKR